MLQLRGGSERLRGQDVCLDGFRGTDLRGRIAHNRGKQHNGIHPFQRVHAGVNIPQIAFDDVQPLVRDQILEGFASVNETVQNPHAVSPIEKFAGKDAAQIAGAAHHEHSLLMVAARAFPRPGRRCADLVGGEDIHDFSDGTGKGKILHPVQLHIGQQRIDCRAIPAQPLRECIGVFHGIGAHLRLGAHPADQQPPEIAGEDAAEIHTLFVDDECGVVRTPFDLLNRFFDGRVPFDKRKCMLHFSYP